MLITVNFLAVVVASVAAFAIGALWYGPLFGRQWRMLMGFGDEAMRSMAMTPAKAMTGGFITTLILVFVLANMLALVGPSSVGEALTLSFWIWLGFVATIMMNSVWYENRPWKLYFINAAHYLVALLVATYILAWWPW